MVTWDQNMRSEGIRKGLNGSRGSGNEGEPKKKWGETAKKNTSNGAAVKQVRGRELVTGEKRDILEVTRT